MSAPLLRGMLPVARERRAVPRTASEGRARLELAGLAAVLAGCSSVEIVPASAPAPVPVDVQPEDSARCGYCGGPGPCWQEEERGDSGYAAVRDVCDDCDPRGRR